ncbi:MAG: tetratricopeptide repeat protein [Bacteroidales bacterium]|nr:tetratricopeptide repeat protein [Bacteroidales bacterium]MDD4384617.1 tetratricopeptide repeat protein [Bacteroidales bacterium]MDY0196863.1 tetratricopeptide repeat protein [Tenuifilaceae bacterium]
MQSARFRALILLFSIISSIAFSQQTLESLEQRMNSAEGDQQILLMIELGTALIDIDQDKALELGLKAAFLSKRIGNPLQEGNAILLMGKASLAADQSEDAIRYFNRALNHFEKNNQSLYQAYALMGIADVYSKELNFNLAVSYLNDALTIARSIQNIALRLDIHQKLGEIAISKNNNSVAFTEFSSVLSILDERDALDIPQQQFKAYAHRQIGLIYRNMGSFNQSLSAYRAASDIDLKLGDRAMEIADKQNIAYSFYLMQEHDSSLIYYNQALAFYRLQKDSISTISVLLGVGDVMFEKKQYRQAVANYNNSYEIAFMLKRVRDQVTSLVNISRCFNAFGDFPTSQEYLSKALAIAKQEGLTNSAADVYMYLSQLSELEGKYSQALDYYKLWAELRDSIYSEQSGQKMVRMQILYEISQKERENEILRQYNEIGELQLTKTQYQRMVFIVLALFLFAILILFGFFYRSKKKEFEKQKETEQRITEMNKALERRMISEIKKQEKQQLLLAQKSKLESLGTLSAGIAHEINQPLGGISMGLDNVLLRLSDKTLSDNYLKEKINLMFDNVDRIKKIIEHTRTFSRSHKSASFERVDVNEMINNALLMVRAHFKKNSITLNLSLSDAIRPVVADKFKLEQVVLNLLSNAKHAVDEKAKTFPDPIEYNKIVEVNTWDDEEFVYISVYDNGHGIKKKDLEMIFDPFFTTKKQDKGTGLGLSISYGFIKDILGDIIVESEEGAFTKFEVKIPKT